MRKRLRVLMLSRKKLGLPKKNKEKGRVCSVAEPKNTSNPAQACKLSDRERA